MARLTVSDSDTGDDTSMAPSIVVGLQNAAHSKRILVRPSNFVKGVMFQILGKRPSRMDVKILYPAILKRVL